jgi:Myb-like DNA-binding domain
MNHNFVFAMFQETALSNIAMLQLQQIYRHFLEASVQEKPPNETKPVFSPTMKGGARDLAWREEEDMIIIQSVKNKGTKNWSKIAKRINREVFSGSESRKGKHCRERWYNHLDPTVKSKIYAETEWTPEEDKLLKELHSKYGNSWSKISKFIIGRTENSVRNRWNSLDKKSLKNNTDKTINGENQFELISKAGSMLNHINLE